MKPLVSILIPAFNARACLADLRRRIGGADVPGGRTLFAANDEEAAMTRRTFELSSDGDPRPLSPGERAGVRAGVYIMLALKERTSLRTIRSSENSEES
jgi:hypothetical protein